MTEPEMIEGYRDGFADDRDFLPEGIANRSASYRHGWLNGIDDRMRRPRSPASTIREAAEAAIKEDQWPL